MTAHAASPLQAVELLDEAFNAGDLESLMSLYEPGAVVVADLQNTLLGALAIRSFFEDALRSGSTAKQLQMHVIEADGIALFLSRWKLVSPGGGSESTERTFTATSVFRRQSDGTWKALIDNPLGPLVLEQPMPGAG